MTTESEKLIEAIVRLIKGTQEGEITWVVEKQRPRMEYETNYKGRRLRLYESAHDLPDLEIIDDNGFTLWTFPRVSGLDDLLSSVRYETTGVKNFLDEIIDDDQLEPESREMSHSR